jgi:hypothetical protein
MFKAFSILAILCACSVEQDTSKQQPFESTVVKSVDSLDNSIASADRMTNNLEKMNKDAITMNYNLVQIFKAVTKCELDATASCDAMREHYLKEYEKKNNTNIKR